MRVICLQENLQRALGTAGRAVASKSTLPILGNFLLEAADDSLTVSATNLDLAVVCTIPAKVETPGRVTLQARVLSEFVSSLHPGEIEMFQDSGPTTMMVRQGATQAHVRGLDPDDFPPIGAQTEDGVQIDVDPESFVEAISQVVFAAATDDSRPVLAGVQLEIQGNQASLAAADGFRMSVRKLEFAQEVAEDVSIIVPARAMHEMVRILSDVEEGAVITVRPNRSQLILSVPDTTLVTRLIDGAFPDLSQIIPSDDSVSTHVIVAREILLDATRRAAIFARSNNDVVRLELSSGEGGDDDSRLVITANAADTGDNRDDVDAQVEGESLQIAFNGRYLNDFLSILKSPTIKLGLQGPNAAGIFRPVDGKDFVHVIMPMVIGSS